MHKSGTYIKNITFREVIRPLRVVFSTAQGQKAVMCSIIIRVSLADGSTGFGECPTSLSLSSETTLVMKGILTDLVPFFRDVPIDEYGPLITKLRSRYTGYPMTFSGLEVALFRARLTVLGITERVYWGGKTRTIETDITIPFTPNRAFLTRWINYHSKKGFITYKLKVSGQVDQDKELIGFVGSTLKNSLDDFTLRLDGNQGYNTETFQRILDYIEKHDVPVELFEQPLRKNDLEGLEEISRWSSIPIILDETVLTEDDAEAVAERHLGHGINIKIAKSGIRGSAAIIAVAKRCDLKLMIGCMTETVVGLSAAVNLAAGTGIFDYVDLDAIFLLHHKNRYGDLTLEGPSFVLTGP